MRTGSFDSTDLALELSDAERRIVAETAALIRQRGFASVTMRDIAAAVGLSKAGLYHHARTKEGIFDLVIRAGTSMLLRQLDEARAHPGTAEDRLLAFLRTRVAVLTSYQDLMTILWQERPLISGDVFTENARMAEEYRHGVRDLIRDAQAEGAVRRDADPHLLMLAIDGMTGWVCFWFHRDGAMSSTEIADAFWSYLVEGVRTRDAQAG